MIRFPWRHSSFAAALFLIPTLGWTATDVNVIGLFNNKAVVSINGSKPRVLTVGDKITEGVKLLSANSGSAQMEIDGKRRTLALEQSISAAPSTFAGNQTATMTADSQGHFITTGTINGVSTQFLVDTGASYVSLSSTEAKRLGIAYLNGERGLASTANGTVTVYLVTADTVKVGDISLHQVEIAVHEGNGLPIALLGMSFLKRLEMKREGTSLELLRRY